MVRELVHTFAATVQFVEQSVADYNAAVEDGQTKQGKLPVEGVL